MRNELEGRPSEPGIPLRELSTTLGVSVATLSRYERGKSISMESLGRIAVGEGWTNERIAHFVLAQANKRKEGGE